MTKRPWSDRPSSAATTESRSAPEPATEPTTVLSLYIADRFFSRLFGLHGRLGPDSGVCLTPCRAVHTCWLRTAIDVVFLDRYGQERKCVQRLKPWRVVWCRDAAMVVELPAGYCADHPYYMTLIRRALGAQDE